MPGENEDGRPPCPLVKLSGPREKSGLGIEKARRHLAHADVFTFVGQRHWEARRRIESREMQAGGKGRTVLGKSESKRDWERSGSRTWIHDPVSRRVREYAMNNCAMQDGKSAAKERKNGDNNEGFRE